MRRGAMLLSAAAMLAGGCQGDTVPEARLTSAVLTITAVPVAGTAATSGFGLVCPIELRMVSEQGTLGGTFERRACSGPTNPTADTRGTFTGVLQADGTTRLTFTPAPLDTFDAISTSGGCPSMLAASGPYDGRAEGAALDVASRFRIICAGRPFPLPPSFDVEYRIGSAPR
jgi:hypothetical protein